MPSIDVPLMTPMALTMGRCDIALSGPLWFGADHSICRDPVQSGMILDHDRSTAMAYKSPAASKGEINEMVRSALRSALGAGFMAAAMASASAQVLEIGVDNGPTGLDPHLTTAFPSFMVVNGNIYEGLTAIDKDLKTVPGLAESWTISADGKTYTFKLRSGVKFHDGSAMEAEDVVSTIKRVLSKDIASPLASRLSAVDSANAVDATTVELKLKEPSAALLSSLATIAIVPSSMEANKDALQKTPVGTGPFKFQEWQPNGFILLAKNEAYWDKGMPKLAGLKFNIVPESATRQVGLSNGQYALLPNIDAATALQLKGKPNVKLAETMDLAYTLIGMNIVEAALRQPEGARGGELRHQPPGDRRCGALRRRRSRRPAVAGPEVAGRST